MTKEQLEDLLIEWGLYEPRAQQSMVDEYNFLTGQGDCSNSNFLNFLKDCHYRFKMDPPGRYSWTHP